MSKKMDEFKIKLCISEKRDAVKSMKTKFSVLRDEFISSLEDLEQESMAKYEEAIDNINICRRFQEQLIEENKNKNKNQK